MAVRKKYRLTRDGPFCLHADPATYDRGELLASLSAVQRDRLVALGWIEEVPEEPAPEPEPDPLLEVDVDVDVDLGGL